MPRQKRELSDAALAMIAERFKLLAEPMRLKILHSLWDGELTVGEIVAERTQIAVFRSLDSLTVEPLDVVRQTSTAAHVQAAVLQSLCATPARRGERPCGKALC